MSRYVIRGRVRPHPQYASLHVDAPTIVHALDEAISDMVAIESSPSPDGAEWLQIALVRPTHQEVFEDVLVAAERAGYSMVEAEVGEIIDEAARGAVLGLIGGGAPGAVADNLIVTLLGAAAGWWVGREVGASMKRVGVVHRYRGSSATGWFFSEIAVARQASGGGRNADSAMPGSGLHDLEPASMFAT
jgi:hypothetical protein